VALLSFGGKEREDSNWNPFRKAQKAIFNIQVFPATCPYGLSVWALYLKPTIFSKNATG
jgi:hypothetical protein